ncbi:MAG: hypothetical protein PHP97_00440 [Candidatus Shapirobacteria bacterium]|nr:hypothetical protein [Candidatus Shapirobacteria bacterium]MDD3002669.1 hypothetical protein [Candidatus Shapirobacteria bacterium]MDD4382850.1 hypothetical protein [Candidatus Shapirobacteria bacterium]
MKKSISRILTLVILVLPIYLTFFANENKIIAVSSLKDQVSNAQLSFFARMSSYSGSTLKVLNSPAGVAPNLFTTNLTIGDSVAIAAGVGSSVFTIKDIGNTNSVNLNAAIGLTVPNGYIIATRSGIHTVSFTPISFGGATEKWQFLIKASVGSSIPFKDGMPDQDGFDIGGSNCDTAGCLLHDVTCPYSTGTANIGTTITFTASDIGDSAFVGTYNVIECAYTGATSKIGTPGTMIIGATNGTQLINPSSSANRTFGVADVYFYGLRQLDTNGNVLDLSFGKIAVDDSVRITAIVDPTLMFTIAGNATMKCGAAPAVSPASSTPTSLNFSSLALESTANNLSQFITATTNASGGYVVQVFENNPLTIVNTTTTLPDTTANNTAWPDVVAYSGFGYSMEVGVTRAGAVLGVGNTGNYKSFGIGYANAAMVLSHNAPSTDNAYMCYRISATLQQPAGEYENSISYIATSTF